MGSKRYRWPFKHALWLVLAGCNPASSASAALNLEDDPLRYIEDAAYRRAILERDLLSWDNEYALNRLHAYSVEGSDWERVPFGETPTLALTAELADAIAAGQEDLDFSDATLLEPGEIPQGEEDWIALGRRVLFEHPVFVDANLSAIVESGRLAQVGFELVDGRWVGLRVLEHEGKIAIGVTCAACHASTATGELDAVLSNRKLDLGLIRLGGDGSSIPPQFDATQDNELGILGPGRSDPQADEVFNPYAFPDFGGLRDMPYLHHSANWHHRGTATLAIRVETTFMQGGDERIHRVLSWALAEFIRSRPAPQPLNEASAESQRGEEAFEQAGCPACHNPPLFTSDRLVGVDEIGTDPAAGLSHVRGTGYYRIPSLRGVGRSAPYLHNGILESLELMFDPTRLDFEPGHPWGLSLSEEERAELVAYLKTI